MNELSSTYSATSLQEHYTDALDIQHVMSELLGDVSGKVILDPAVGKGALLKSLIGIPNSIDGVDVNADSLDQAKHSFPGKLNAIHSDFLDLFVLNPLHRCVKLKAAYDAVIANPPYGLKMSIQYRKAIKRAYPDVYARESYGLFLDFSLRILRPNGRYVFIVPDTFIHSVNHKPLRRALLSRGRPSHIIQFPSRFFESVNFGYANLCIIAGNGDELRPEDAVKWIDGTKQKTLLPDLLGGGESLVSGRELIASVEAGWVHPNNQKRLHVISSPSLLGDVAECRTGIYSGDNRRFFGYDSRLPKVRGAGHSIDWTKQVANRTLTGHERENGISDESAYVPLIKGGHRKPFEKTSWAVDWSKEAIEFYRTDKKARLQNARFYFKTGLAVPMVTSGRISASWFSDSVFDQGVVGVFPKNDELLPFLLIYLNSGYVSEMKRSLNASANNSANYMKRLPVPRVSDTIMADASKIIEDARENGWETTKDDREELISCITTQDMT